MKPSDLLHNSTLQTEAAVIAALALAHRNPADVRFESATNERPALLLAPPDMHIRSLERFCATPRRPEIHISLDSAKDLHAYVIAQTVRDADPHSDNPIIFASRDKQLIKAYLDYHHAEEPRWLNHTAEVQYRQSHQFKKWNENNNKHLTQEQFALFIDEMLADFSSPTGAEMLSFATCLSTHSEQTFKASTRLATGETELVFTDARKGDISTTVIDEFEIGIPIWQNGVKVAITAKLFHRVTDVRDSTGNLTGAKTLKFWYHLRHLERIIDTLFAEEIAFLNTAFNGIAPIYSGTPPETPEADTDGI